MAEKQIDKIKRLMKDPTKIRNIGTSAHIDHGKTTFSDNLMFGAGMVSGELAGKQRALDFHEDEAERGITIDAANVSMVHGFGEKEYLINLIDTPGHVDFGGDVTRAMRAIDGTIVLTCAVEGTMPQTETVLRQALKERVRPILFINKVDRLIKELKLTPEQMQQSFMKQITNINRLIGQIAEDDYKEKWKVNVADGSVMFGSAFHNWALSVPYMQENSITFADIIAAYQSDDDGAIKELAKRAPLHEIVLNSVIRHHPAPKLAQSYRIPKIWRGEDGSPEGRALLTCDPEGDAAFVCTKIVVDKHAGEIAAGRIFSGKLTQGQEVYLIGGNRKVRIQQLSVYNGPKRELIDEAYPGNIIGIVGLKDVFSGETVSSKQDFTAFEGIKHIFDPVVTKAIEAMRPSDLPKLVEVLRQVNKEDPTIVIQINEETGEHLISGMGELHLEVIENRIRSEKNVEVKTSPPVVVFRETVQAPSPAPFEGKSPNKHNKFYFTVEPLDEAITKAIKEGNITEGRIKKKDDKNIEELVKVGMDRDDAKRVRDVFNGNIIVDGTKGIVYMNEVIELILDSFEDVMNNGPLAREPCLKIKVTINDVKLHEDAIHRGPAQVYPAVREGIRGAMMQAKPIILEPVLITEFDAPIDYVGEISKLISNRRGQLLDMNQDDYLSQTKAKMPVAESFGLTGDLRSATGGRGSQFVIDQLYEQLPFELQTQVVKQIRQRKGLGENE
jgi:elongation factor 2